MADNKNMALDDDMMTKATGGAGSADSEPKFKVGDYVHYELTNP